MKERLFTFWINCTIVHRLGILRVARNRIFALHHVHVHSIKHWSSTSASRSTSVRFLCCTWQLITFIYFRSGCSGFDHSSVNREWYVSSTMLVILCMIILLIYVSILADWIEELMVHHVFLFRCMKCMQIKLILVCSKCLVLAPEVDVEL